MPVSINEPIELYKTYLIMLNICIKIKSVEQTANKVQSIITPQITETTGL